MVDDGSWLRIATAAAAHLGSVEGGKLRRKSKNDVVLFNGRF
jgi:hypothetical protein